MGSAKGASTNPLNKRLAMPTEDHPLDYALTRSRTIEEVAAKAQAGKDLRG